MIYYLISMPVSSKCWYNDCNSQPRDDTRLLFYRFPKDPERCEQWVHNCSNPELTNIYNTNPDKFANLRVCQKHFLKEFLGTSSRLVGHAIPVPYGTAMDGVQAEKFMVGCASLKTSNNSNHSNRVKILHPKTIIPESNNHELPEQASADNINYTYKQINPIENILDLNKSCGGLMSTNCDRRMSDNIITGDFYQSDSFRDYSSALIDSEPEHFHTIEGVSDPKIDVAGTSSSISIVINETQATTVDTNLLTTSRLNGHANPKINYDKEGRVVSIQYPTETLSLIQKDDIEQHKAHIVALKYKLRHYQRKLAVINHRYQKLRGQIKGRSNRMRLLENLKLCQADFDPCVFELFKRQIKGPSSKHGNRWSPELKAFSSSIYLQSRSAYRIVRKTIDLPSEFIVKQYIVEKKLSKSIKSVESQSEDEIDEAILNQDKELGIIYKEPTFSLE